MNLTSGRRGPSERAVTPGQRRWLTPKVDTNESGLRGSRCAGHREWTLQADVGPVLVLREHPDPTTGDSADETFPAQDLEGPHDRAHGDPVLLGQAPGRGQRRAGCVLARGDALPQQVSELLVGRTPGQWVDHEARLGSRRMTWSSGLTW